MRLRVRKLVLCGLAVCFLSLAVLVFFFQTKEELISISFSEVQSIKVPVPPSALGSQYHGEDLPLSLDTITWFDRIKWSAQVIVAPEGLDDVLTVYLYTDTDPKLTDFFAKNNIRSFSTWYVGRAYEGESGWTIEPLDSDEVGDCLQGSATGAPGQLWKKCFNIDESDSRQGVVSNTSFSGVRATAKLWGNTSSWDEVYKRIY